MKPTQFIGIIGITGGLLLITQALWSLGQPEPSNTDQPVVIFEIGKEDRSEYEFKGIGFSEQTEFKCRTWRDCSSQTFPLRLYRPQINERASDGVEIVTITFKLLKEYTEVVLRLARAGVETDVVTIDKKQTYLVTKTMLGSAEGVWGAYDLSLGALEKGRHTIELTLADDGTGNGMHVWDALALFAK